MAFDGVAFYYERTPENGLVFLADAIVLGGAKAGEKIIEGNGRLINGLGKGSLSDIEARQWYLDKEKGIPNLIDKTKFLEKQAKEAFELRNKFRKEARELMSNRELADKLNREEKNMTWDDIVDKYKKRGYKGDEVYKEIIESSQRSRTSVNKKLGLDE